MSSFIPDHPRVIIDEKAPIYTLTLRIEAWLEAECKRVASLREATALKVRRPIGGDALSNPASPPRRKPGSVPRRS